MRASQGPTLHVAATVLAGLVLSACSALTGDASAGLSGLGNGDVAARSGGALVTTAELETAVDDAVAAGALQSDDFTGSELERRVQLQTAILNTQLQIAIVEAVALDDFEVVVTDAEVDAAVELAIAQAGGAEQFEQQLAANGSDLDRFVQGQRVSLLVQEVTAALAEDDPVTDEDVRAQFEQRRGEFEQVNARHILVGTAEEAQDVLDRLEAGEAFADLATELSLDPGSGQAGGVLGLAPRGTFVPEFEAAIWDGPAEPGEVLGPVQTQFGFHVIVVDEFVTTPEDEALARIRAELEAGRGGDLFGFWFRQVLADSGPEVAGRFGRWDRTAQSIVRDGETPSQPGA